MKEKETRADIEAKINRRAWKDPAFKKMLQTNPREALTELGLHIPTGIKIRVHEEDQTTWDITIRKAPLNVQNISEEELRHLSAGYSSVA